MENLRKIKPKPKVKVEQPTLRNIEFPMSAKTIRQLEYGHKIKHLRRLK